MSRHRALLAACFAAILAAVAAVSGLGPVSAAGTGVLLAWVGGGIAWVAALALVLRFGARLSPRALVFGAGVLRAVALVGDPGLSDDIYRYAWEGGLVAQGTSPYAFAPDAPELAAERARWPTVYAGLNNRDVSAAYPPVVQLACAGVVLASGGPERALLPLRGFFATCDLLVLVPLFALLARFGLPASAALAWAWSPLAALESAGSGHFDALGVLLLLVALLWLGESAGSPVSRSSVSGPPGSSPSDSPASRARQAVGIAALAAAVSTKYIPLAALPFVARRRPLRAVLVLALCAAAFAPLSLLRGAGRGLGRGLGEYGLRWESASLVHRWVEAAIVGSTSFAADGSLTDPRVLGRLFAGACWVGALLFAWRRGFGPVRATGLALAAFLVLTPTLHPWYALWILPFLALRPSLAWCALLALLPLAYWPLPEWVSSGSWIEPVWLWPALALPFFALLALELSGRRAFRSSALGASASGGRE